MHDVRNNGGCCCSTPSSEGLTAQSYCSGVHAHFRTGGIGGTSAIPSPGRGSLHVERGTVCYAGKQAGFGVATGACCAVLQCFRVARTVYGATKKRHYYRTLFSCLTSPHLTVVTRMASCLPHIAGVACSTSSRGCKVCTPQHLIHACPHDISKSCEFQAICERYCEFASLML